MAPRCDGARSAPPPETRHNEDLVWLIRRILEGGDRTVCPGGPWLPNEWLDEASIRQNLNVLARRNGAYLLEYGNPSGYLPLREHFAGTLGEIGVTAQSSQIVLTQGTSQALDLIIRRMLRPGDHVLVDDPGYYNLFGNLRLSDVQLCPVPRLPDGPDMDALERLAATHQPKLYFTQSVLQNPTGSTMAPHVAFRVLQAAQRYDFRIVEDDIFCDLQAAPTPRLATLDQLQRVIYVRSFSKTLSGSLRVGFAACQQEIADALVEVKMLTSITSSQFAERLIYLMLVDGHYRKYIARLQKRLADARVNVLRAFEQAGLELFMEPSEGMFLWARSPRVPDSLCLAEKAAADGFVLAPGTVFRPLLEESPWMRFNVAVCDAPNVQRRLETLLNEWVIPTG
ncbi:MAG TPA: PLP-dependent aminotransferase family protein [Acetobacteraceae bacterium]|nr:PLP-dependent aminotransferase family protein [Acetobacteraceae bacterium]